jgi:hypothetical protein
MSARSTTEHTRSITRRLIKREESAAMGETTPKLANHPMVLTVERDIKLVHVPPGTPSRLYSKNAQSIFCIGVGDGQFSLGDAISWVRSALTDITLEGERRLPFVVVFGNAATLSEQNINGVSREMLRLGAYFVKWPEGCTSFEEAFKALRDEIAQNY